ncbi:GDP-mannose 4,6-dehydratase [Patescibacteria group bacterium]
MQFLITGGCGFIGTNFAEKLMERGDEVTLLDNLSRKGTVANLSYLKNKYPNIKFLHADIRSDINKLIDVMENVDAVYHLAGQVAVTTSVSNPREDFEINALGTFNVLEAIRLSERKPLIIYSSTNKVYGGMEDIEIVKEGKKYIYKDVPEGIPEDRLLDFHSPYGCSKGAADQYIRDYARMFDIKSVVMRQSCIYGKRQFGVEDQGWVAWFTIAANLDKPLTIYGDGMQVRDVLYVDDLFEAWDLATKQIDTVSGQIFNIGGGPKFTLSLLELLSMLEGLLGKKIAYTFDKWRPGDQPVYVSDISKAEKVLGWKPKIVPEEGVKRLTEWTLGNANLINEQLGS